MIHCAVTFSIGTSRSSTTDTCSEQSAQHMSCVLPIVHRNTRDYCCFPARPRTIPALQRAGVAHAQRALVLAGNIRQFHSHVYAVASGSKSTPMTRAHNRDNLISLVRIRGRGTQTHTPRVHAARHLVRLWSSGLRVEAACNAAIRPPCDDRQDDIAASALAMASAIVLNFMTRAEFAGFPAALEHTNSLCRSSPPGP
jgi:hypothetical protein